VNMCATLSYKRIHTYQTHAPTYVYTYVHMHIPQRGEQLTEAQAALARAHEHVTSMESMAAEVNAEALQLQEQYHGHADNLSQKLAERDANLAQKDEILAGKCQELARLERRISELEELVSRHSVRSVDGNADGDGGLQEDTARLGQAITSVCQQVT
jgi:hypothetical protein